MIKNTIRYWWKILQNSIALWLERNAFSYAGSLAFYTLFSLAPTIIIAVTVIGLVLGENAAQGQIVAQLQDTIGTDAAQAIQNAVAQSRIEESGIFPTLFGVGALLIGATTVFAQMQFSLNTIWGVVPKPTGNSALIFLKSRVLSLAVVVSIGFIMLVSLVAGVVLRTILNQAQNIVPAVGMIAGSTEFLLSLAVIAALFAAIFKILPDVVLSWKDVLIGAIVTAVLFAIGRYGIAAYLAYTATASTYGAAGSVVLILLWVYYSSLILLFGAAFTKCHLLARGKKIRPRNTAVVVKQELVTREIVQANGTDDMTASDQTTSNDQITRDSTR
ncbi:YihY/virulence factor BrkB family protein [Pistricoccus aurantiacus]|uniref:YihY/virulence factor BrkB family protein n=1 Tax=Pistricoccus aurantiacus TaxID=1883414 RepID=A0A5B8SYN6_9GAMM|nr:YihY/virulence factor BrkB family protein [Pistricoccus aurantiacus]QEA39933.1 YihY/virulence factor BrkB family protein [Pistricoccus aurantiacus]